MKIITCTLKKLLPLTILTSVTSLNLLAQDNLFYCQAAKTWEFGPRIGFTTSIINSKGDNNIERGVKLGLAGGVFARYQWADQWALHSDLSYSTRGNKSKTGNWENSYIDFSAVPLRNVKYSMFNQDMTFDFFVGPGISFLFDAVDKDNADNDLKQLLPSTEFNLVFGGSLPFGPVLLTATSRVGLTNLFGKVSSSTTWYSFSTEWTAAYRFK